ncbi:MAG: DJ-1/PfpI family protein [Muribaculaceae bacterium]|nr:DJ-1/PfpI family protein [Muribaculaceae bacterium]MDE7080403.1 DJ-1/PfpI family protein [Muribaculaceae bacterium]
MKQSFLFLAQGFEEVEALTVVDVLRRAGIPVKTVSITESLQVTGAHGISVKADVLYDNTLFDAPEWLILPGGMPGAEHLYNFAPLQGLLERQVKGKSGRVAAICAAPAVVLGQLGLLEGAKATCYPGFEELLKGAKYEDSPVVVDGKFITSSGPANALAWALTIVRETVGSRQSNQVAAGMLAYPPECSSVDFG